MKVRVLTMDIVVLASSAVFLIVAFSLGDIWIDRCMGTLLMFTGLYFTLWSYGFVSPVARRPSTTFKLIGPFVFIQGFCLLFFHVRF